MMDTFAEKVWRLVVEAAREVYVPSRMAPEDMTYPIDRRCPGCGLYLDGCESGLCSQRHEEED